MHKPHSTNHIFASVSIGPLREYFHVQVEASQHSTLEHYTVTATAAHLAAKSRLLVILVCSRPLHCYQQCMHQVGT